MAIALGARDLFSLDGPGWAIVLALYFSAILTASFVAMFVQQYRHARRLARRTEEHRSELRALVSEHRQEIRDTERQSRTTAALPDIHAAFHALRDAASVLQQAGNELEGPSLVAKSLDPLNRAFTAMTSAPCRLSVKSLEARPDAPDEVRVPRDARFLQVRTYCRHDGRNPAATAGPDPLIGNSDFLAVWDPEVPGRCFFSNDLDREPSYQNTHRTHGDPDAQYNSTIVWPIQRKYDDRNIDLWGYLCLDSTATNRFVYAIDFHLGAAFADTLYSVVTLLGVTGDIESGSGPTSHEPKDDRGTRGVAALPASPPTSQ